MISHCSWNLLELKSCFMDVFYNLYKYIWHLNNINQLSYSNILRSNITFSLKLSNFHFYETLIIFSYPKKFLNIKLYSFENWYWYDTTKQYFLQPLVVRFKIFIRGDLWNLWYPSQRSLCIWWWLVHWTWCWIWKMCVNCCFYHKLEILSLPIFYQHQKC